MVSAQCLYVKFAVVHTAQDGTGVASISADQFLTNKHSVDQGASREPDIDETAFQICVALLDRLRDRLFYFWDADPDIVLAGLQLVVVGF